MSADLITDPRWLPEQLGQPMPDDRHAVSACLPLWAHNIGYEEGDADVVGHLQAAYPRFCFHPAIRELCRQKFGDGEPAGLPFVSDAAAKRAAQYVEFRGGTVEGLLPGDGWTGVQVAAESFSLLKQYWQHAGEILSSRAADEVLQGRTVSVTEIPERSAVRDRMAKLQDCCSSFPCASVAKRRPASTFCGRDMAGNSNTPN